MSQMLTRTPLQEHLPSSRCRIVMAELLMICELLPDNQAPTMALRVVVVLAQKCFPDLQAVEPVRPPNSHPSSRKRDVPEETSGEGAANAASMAQMGLLRDQYHISLSRPATVRYSQVRIREERPYYLPC